MATTDFTNIPLTPFGKLAYPYTTEDAPLVPNVYSGGGDVPPPVSPRYTNPATFWYSARIHHDGVPTKRPCLIYFHGSLTTGTGFLSDTDPAVVDWRALGFNVISARSQGVGTSSNINYDNSYGSSLAGNPFGSFSIGAYHVESMIDFADVQKATYFTTVPYVLAGFSLGASRACAWSMLSNLFGASGTRVKAIWAAAPALGGGGISGTKAVANANLMTNGLSQIAMNVKHPTLLAWGSGDLFCPPDMQRRIQAGCKMSGNTLAEFSFPGSSTHASSALGNDQWQADFTAFLTAHGARP